MSLNLGGSILVTSIKKFREADITDGSLSHNALFINGSISEMQSGLSYQNFIRTMTLFLRTIS